MMNFSFLQNMLYTSAWDSLLGQWVSGGSSWRGHASTSTLPDLSSPAPSQTGRCGVAGKQGLCQGRQDLQCGGWAQMPEGSASSCHQSLSFSVGPHEVEYVQMVTCQDWRAQQSCWHEVACWWTHLWSCSSGRRSACSPWQSWGFPFGLANCGQTPLCLQAASQ